MHRARLIVVALAALACAACGADASGSATSAATRQAQTASLLRWPAFVGVRHPLDTAGPLADGSLLLWARGRLWTLSPSGRMASFANSYYRPGNAEPYIGAPAPGHSGCSFGTNTVYVLRLYGQRGVVAVTRGGPIRTFALIAAPGLINGIAFDETGKFGHRLLVTINEGLRTTVDAIDCHGHVSTITRSAPRVEGGMVVALPPFGPFAGDLIAPDEKSGRIYAITPGGKTILVARSGLPFGQDIGVESEVQAPNRRYGLLGADRLTPGNRHPGDNALLRVGSGALARAGVRAFDLLVATEGGARLIDISCAARPCRVREVAAGPARAHLEGHLAVTLH